MSARTVIVIAKQPKAGRVKTRLQSRYSPQQAARLAVAALQDTLAAVSATKLHRRVVALEGEAGPWLPGDFEVIAQGDGGLDARIEHSFAGVFETSCPADPSDPDVTGSDRAGPVLLIGMDTPQVTPDLLATEWNGADAAIGLCPDGGFWAVGLRRYVPGAFVSVPMSTDHTGADQLARLRSLGLRVHLLPELRDVDTPADADAIAALVPGTLFAAEYRRCSTGPTTRRRRPDVVHLVQLPAEAPAQFEDADAGSEEHPLDLYGEALAGLAVQIEFADGQVVQLDTDRWSGPPDEVDLALLDRCEGSVLDLGCGPGRLVGALAAGGKPALGVDICEAAARQAAARGANVLVRAVQDRLPAEGRWDTVLLADGNIGIDGDPDAILRRCATLLRPMGLLLVEADPDDDLEVRERVRLVSGRRRTRRLAWARLGRRALGDAAHRQGFLVADEWRAGGRVFLALRSVAHTRSVERPDVEGAEGGIASQGFAS